MSTLPDPFATTPLSIRIPVVLRERLEALASVGGNNLTQEVVTRLQKSCWPAGDTATQQALAAIEFSKVMRMRSGSTSSDIRDILAVTHGLGVDRLVFAVRPNELNGACMVMILQCEYTTLLMDGSWINMAREPRIGEVEQLLQQLDAVGLLRTALWCPHLVPITEKLSPDEALEAVLAAGKPVALDLKGYLDLLSGHGFYDIGRFRAPVSA